MSLARFVGSTLSRVRRAVSRFAADRQGNVAIIFGVISIPLITIVGTGVDYGLASRLKVKLQAATDGTALMLCATPSTTLTADLQLQAQVSMTDYMGTAVSLTVDALTVKSSPRTILLTTHAVSKAYFAKFFSNNDLPITSKSQCASPVPQTFEIALVLDTTGSMANSGGSGTKLSAMQTAASNFIDYVKNNPAFASDSRMSIVPFAASVNVGSAYAAASWVDTAGVSAYHWTNVDKTQAKAAGFVSRMSIFTLLAAKYSSWAWGGCFETLPYPANTQDGTPTGNDTLYVPMFAPDEPGGGTTGIASFTSSGNTYYSYNSYLDDTTSIAGCKTNPGSFQAAEYSACKYVIPNNVSYTTNNSVGVPNGPNFLCTSKPLQRLTTNATTLKNLITSLTAIGSTNIHEGLMWGWRTLSPSSVFADGVSYSSTAASKVMILMTDGTNSWSTNPYSYNQSLYFPMGYFQNANGTNPNPRLPTAYQNISNANQARAALDQLTLEGCTNAKKAGISIYTIGFSVSSDPIDSQGTTLLANCASSSGQAYIANDSSSLIAAFAQIANSIGKIRLTQ